jgi:hypothetical protein
MNVSMRYYLFLFCLLSLQGVLFGQQRTTGMKVLVRPSEYISGPFRVLPKLEQSERRSINSKWVVYSDRDDNFTYTEPDSTSDRINRLSYLQPLYVVGETDDFVQVIAYDRSPEAIDLNTLTIKKELASYGWLPKSRALLWICSMVDEKTKFTRKCLAINSIQSLIDIESQTTSGKLVLYTQPGGKRPTESRVLLYNFVFVFKEEGNYLLIGKKMIMAENSVQTDILGWVSKDIVQPWSHRVALEPLAGGPGAERRRLETPARLFTQESDAAHYARGEEFSPYNVIPYEDKYAEPMNPIIPRLPILKEVSKDPLIYYTGTVTPVFNSNNDEVMSVEEQSKVNEQYEVIRRKRSNVNIVFVVDGSEYMRRYTRPICTAVRRATNTMKSMQSTANFEYGAVFYRSVAEKDCGLDEIRQKALTTDEEALIKFLGREEVRDDCGTSGEYRSVLKGIKRAIDLMSKEDSKNETNIIILIGARGNDNKDYDQKEQLAQELARINCSLMAFQVQNVESEESFQRFYTGVDIAIRRSETLISQEHSDIWPTKTEAVFQPRDGGSILEMPFPQDAPVPGLLIQTDPGNPMDPVLLEREIRNIIVGCIDNNDRLFAKGDAHTRGMGKRVVMDEALRNMLGQMNVEIDLLKLASYDNIQFFRHGYTPMSRVGSSDDFYGYVLLLSDLELRKLMRELETLVGDESLTLSERRKHIEEAFKALAKTYFGFGESKSKVDIMSMADVLDRLYGVPGYKRSEVFNVNLNDIDNLAPGQVEEIKDEFATKLTLIEEFIRMNHFDNFSEVYYWLPQRILP